MTISLRPAKLDDEEFLFSVYVSTRMYEMELVDWNPSQKDVFLRMQFRAQSEAYMGNYSGADFTLVLLDGLPIGRLYIQRTHDEIHVLDISLLPQYRSKGIGSHLLKGILEEAAQSNRQVTLYVERHNPALHLYGRLGFHQVSDQGVHLFLKWLPSILEKNEDTRSTAMQ